MRTLGDPRGTYATMTAAPALLPEFEGLKFWRRSARALVLAGAKIGESLDSKLLKFFTFLKVPRAAEEGGRALVLLGPRR